MPENSANEFTLPAYKTLLTTFQSMGYQAVGYEEVETDKSHLVVRHDIDMTIAAAPPLAEIEHELDIRAVYFILLRSDLYNPFSRSNREYLRDLQRLNHEIGLHFDASLYNLDNASLDTAAQRECALLEDVLGSEVRAISFHRPAKTLLGYDNALAGRLHAYQPIFFNHMGYCSDSCGAWHHGHPLDHPAVQKRTALQLLTHPIWWNRQESLDPADAANEFRIYQDLATAKSLSENCRPYLEKFGQRPVSLMRQNQHE